MEPIGLDQLSQSRHPRRQRSEQAPERLSLNIDFVDAGAIARHAEKFNMHFQDGSMAFNGFQCSVAAQAGPRALDAEGATR